MLKYLWPDLYLEKVTVLDEGILKKYSLKGLILDLDNTISPWGERTIPQDVVKWVKRMQKLGIRFCLVSNNSNGRVQEIADFLGIPYVARAIKPRRRAFLRAVHLMGLKPLEVAVIGDQLLTDIMGAKRAGLMAILVNPMASREFIGTKINRFIEGHLLKRLFRKGLKIYVPQGGFNGNADKR
ncbi:YqeG family HAD IIIA-type phosphatase [Carboxydothermus pertinax]|uniref:HAD superfamily hydrolase n=1 Tax=Carboxydothermus pertinax TaxID=870242 RepID=A0A1L8CVT2_9THEO|nr:YqeG family HAD IIIA-type phosphatase [Carboxydothermus pertinax]GAV22974.1 HAD superfamily hydrolase [Carboxydothermus pertinax]